MEINDIQILKCIIHKVGNKSKKENVELSNEEFFLTDEINDELGKYFFTPFKQVHSLNKFTHDFDLNLNEIFICAEKIFAGEDFKSNSINICNHLYNQTNNPAIKSGNLFIVLLNDIIIENVITQGIGIFKSERKDVFFNINKERKGNFTVSINKGINNSKLDKGCIIIDDDDKNGFKVLTYEYKGSDTKYWREDFLSITPINNNYHKTQKFLSDYKEFVLTELPTNVKISKAEQIDLVNRTVDFFKANDKFEQDKFNEEVLENTEIIDSYISFKKNLPIEDNLVVDDFNISNLAVKKQEKSFKKVLKLDKNFHIYVHGRRDLIEHGFDEIKQKRFYKIFFDEET